MAALPPLSPEISHQALRFACDLMGFTQPDYGGHENFVLSRPTDLNAALHNITNAALGDGLYGTHPQTVGSGYGTSGGVHVIQGVPEENLVIQEKPGGVHVITAGSSVNIQSPTSGVNVQTPSGSDTRPEPDVSVQVLGGGTTNTNINCNGLCIETAGGVIPVETGPGSSSGSSQTVPTHSGLVTMTSFQPSVPDEQTVSSGGTQRPTVPPGEVLAGIATLPVAPQPQPPGIAGLPVLQGMANVVLAGGPTDGASGESVVSPSTVPTARPSQGPGESPSLVEDLLQNLLSATGITNSINQVTQPGVIGTSPPPPNRVSTPLPSPPAPSLAPSPPLPSLPQVPPQLPPGSPSNQSPDVTDNIISNINCLVSEMAEGGGLGVVERPCVVPSPPAPPSSGAASPEAATPPPLVPVPDGPPLSHVITDGIITINSDGVMTTTHVGEGTWFEPTEASDLTAGALPTGNGDQTSEGGGGVPGDGDILIDDITGGITDVPENAELPDFPPNFVFETLGGEDGANENDGLIGANITPDSVNISSTIEILSTLGTVEDIEEIPLKDGYFELHIYPTQPVPSPTASELEFRVPPFTIVTTTYPSLATVSSVRAALPAPVTTLQLTPVATRFTTTTTAPTYASKPTPSPIGPTTSWGDLIVFNELGFWKPPAKRPSSLLTVKRLTRRPSSNVYQSNSQPSEGKPSTPQPSILYSLKPEGSVEASRPSVPNSNPFAGEPEPTELADIFSQLEPSAPVDDSPVNVINIQQIDPSMPMMMMMSARLNYSDSPIISVLPKPPFLAPQRVTATTTIITTIGRTSTSDIGSESVGSGSSEYIPPGSGSESSAFPNRGNLVEGSPTEANSQQELFISLHEENGGSPNHITTGGFDTHSGGSVPFQSISDVLPVSKKPDRFSTWTDNRRTSTTEAPHVLQSGGWLNLFTKPTTTSTIKPKFNKYGFWKPTRRPMVFSRVKYKQNRKGGSAKPGYLLNRHRTKGEVTSTTTRQPATPLPTRKPSTSTYPPRITTLDITSAAADGTLPNLIMSLFGTTKSPHFNGPDPNGIFKPHQPATRPSTIPSTPSTRKPTVTIPTLPTTTSRPAPTPKFNKYGFWKPTKRPYNMLMRRLRQRMKDRTRMPSTTKAPAPPPVGPPILPPRRSYVNGNFRAYQKRPAGWRGRRDAPSPPPQPVPSSSSASQSASEPEPTPSLPDPPTTSIDLLLDSVGRSFGAAPAGGVQASPEARMFRNQFRPGGRYRRRFSGRCITRCWLGTVGILGGVGGLAALSVPVYLLLVGSLGGSGAAGGVSGAAGAAAGAAAGGAAVGGVVFNEPIPDPVTGPGTGTGPIPIPLPVPDPIPLPIPDPIPPDVPDPKPPGEPGDPKPPAPPDSGTGQPPGPPEEESVKPPAPPTTDTGGPGPFIEGPDTIATTFVNVNPADGQNLDGTPNDGQYVPPETTVFGEQITRPNRRPAPVGVIGVPTEPDRISAVLGQNFGPETAECKNYKLCILHAKTQDTTKRKPPRWFFTTYLYEGSFASLCQQMARKPTVQLCRKLFPHCVNTTKFGFGY
ncbi:mucin-2-like [Amphibalanus amphitrite]|uniref:mucin-2-like n=1 Tax=Amphibalanus amphitrite TaxID=1232801 RepID=UPI001C90BD0F|nr:mucin-2-like [Amphibalanus amphitrite]